MTELDSSSRRKRDAWAARQNTSDYIRRMGWYAVLREAGIVRRMLGVGPGRLLDLPCGTGRFLALEKELGFDVTAADYSPTMLAVAQKDHPDVDFVRADAFAPPFQANTFDVILIPRLLFHYRNPEAILAALVPALKPGGRMVFDTLNRFSTRWLASQVQNVLLRDPARWLYFQTFRSMHLKLAPLGLEVVERESAYVLPTRLYRFLPRVLAAVVSRAEKAVPSAGRVLTFWHVRRGKGA